MVLPGMPLSWIRHPYLRSIMDIGFTTTQPHDLLLNSPVGYETNFAQDMKGHHVSISQPG